MIVFLCLYLFLSVVLSGLCSNDCPENVKVSSDLFFSLSLSCKSLDWSGNGMCLASPGPHAICSCGFQKNSNTRYSQCSTQSLSSAYLLIEYFSLSMFSFFLNEYAEFQQ